VDVLGEDGLSKLGTIEPPDQHSSARLPRVAIPRTRQQASAGAMRAGPELKAGQGTRASARRVAAGRPPGRTPGAGASGCDGA
jgi:hypothetical protein